MTGETLGVPTRPRVALILTGGTIDSIGVSRLDHAWYYRNAQRLGPGELAGSVPELSDIAEIAEVPFRRLSSYALTTRDWLGLLRLVRSLVRSDEFDGVVIAHGTNTLEETAYFLHLTVGSDKPVVLVGAMRPPGSLGADGSLNLYRAATVAVDPAAAGLGVLVVMNGAIFSARDVTKTSPYGVDAFRAPDLGPLGHTDADGRAMIYHRPVRVPDGDAFDVADLDDLPRVDVVVSYVGADEVLIDACVAAGARGIVSAGTGAARPTPSEDEALRRAVARGIVICHATRVGSGRVTLPGAPGADGRVAAGNLQPWKAKVLLSLALTRTTDATAIQGLFDRL